MAKTRDLRRRIRSVRNTMQLTRAMKMVSAAKLRRAQERMFQARPYAHSMTDVLRSLAARTDPSAHPLLQVRPEEQVELVVVTSDKGLCGAFNANILKKAVAFLQERSGQDVQLNLVGKKGRDFFRRRTWPILQEWVDLFRGLDLPVAQGLGQQVIDRYVYGEIDAVYLVYNEFKSAVAQRPVLERLLPLSPLDPDGAPPAEDYIWEPGPAALLDVLLPRYVTIGLYRALLESSAAEHAARMSAMSAATKNAGELIDRLTLHMNRVRQASITTEIIEVVSGAQALG